ncbi:hypothetical protein H0H92_002583 [Tricholoma furcatifolium]|nr:hypothetical protein H0H92_002583 [Tricholoma furcatifolium]
MALSRSARITLLLIIDIIFFFIELIVGYAVGSLALVADSFHMLKAEILAALINGVFLLALCFSIFLESIERFFSTPEHGHSHSHSHSKPSSLHTPSMAPSRPESINAPLKSPARENGSRSPIQSDFSSLYGHPVATRASVVQQAHDIALARAPSPTAQGHISSIPEESTSDHLHPDELPTEETPLLGGAGEPAHHHGHSHGSMNMRSLVLHVMGDALGNVGVIATGLVIWLTQWSWKYYFDPVISLVITVIIFSSALPLVKSASSILLQGVPPTISLDGVRASILAVDGVLSVHELHVWQLSESKVIASVHVLTSKNTRFMEVASAIRKVLHHHGIHSSTIQPEYLETDGQNKTKRAIQQRTLVVVSTLPGMRLF